MKQPHFSVAALVIMHLSQCTALDVQTFGDYSYKEKMEQKDRELFGNIVSIADAIANAVPTVPTTPEPTQEPTKSLMPSLSPTDYPTAQPTISSRPTIPPTGSPSVSHKPSPSPTSEPTSEPTKSPSIEPTHFPTITPAPTLAPTSLPTNLPTHIPSIEPSSFPTKSAEPSQIPTDFPSASPTSRPTVSMIPSLLPSLSPTVSVAPSDLPSQAPSENPSSMPSISMAPTPFYTISLRQTFVLTFEELDHEMNKNVTMMFELITHEFLQNTMAPVPGGAITISSVQVLSQSLILPNAAAQTSKGGNNHHRLLPSGLEVLIEVSAEYESWVPEDQFDFEAHIFVAFEENWALYKNLLLEGSIFFTPLVVPFTQKRDGDNSNTSDTLHVGRYATLCVVSVLAVTLGLTVSAYAVRRFNAPPTEKELEKDASFDQPLQSYMTSSSVDSLEKHPAMVPEQQLPSRMQEDTNVHSIEPSRSTLMTTIESCTAPTHLSPTNNATASPNTLERGSNQRSDVGGLASNILCQMSCPADTRQQDPPDSNSARRNFQGEPAGQKAMQMDPIPHNMRGQNMEDDRETTVSNALRGSNIFKISRDPSVVGVKFPYDDDYAQSETNYDRGYGQEWSSEASRDAAPSTHGGRLGAADINSSYHRKPYGGSSTPVSSAYSSSINAFLNMVGGTLGARPLDTPTQSQSQVSNNGPSPAHFHPNNYDDTMGGGGLYDVFAPSGALGIVVDTTKDGPAVHSLKQNSPMLGLINPGDLIVGLDDEDTRNMTAATLTRLMARKSHQHERKITLMTGENY